VINLRAIPLVRSRYLFAMMAGIVLGISLPTPGVAGLAWVAPGLILGSALGKQGWETFRIGYVAGMAHCLVSLRWLLFIPYRWYGIPLGPAAGWLALSAYLAVYPAIWVWLMIRLRGAKSFSEWGWTSRTIWAVGGGIIWVGLEMVIARLWTGFPWNLLGATQYQLTPLIQIASLTGIYGVSFLLVWTSLSLVSATTLILQRPTCRAVWAGEMLLPMAAIAILFHYGFRRMADPATPKRSIRVTCVQPNIPQTVIWDSSKDDARFQELLELSEHALTNKTDLLLWPEAAVPKLLRYDESTFHAVTNLAGSHHVWLIIGADDAEPRLNSNRKGDADFYNSSFLISPEGRLVNRYRKRSLVIFGEYIPLIRWIPFFKWFTPIEGGFTSGDRAVPFKLPDLNAKTSVLICFEDVFPHLVREYPESDTDFLVNLTNNGWFGEDSAQWQHAVSALFRAVENGIPLVRCSNNGLTCWVDARGRLQKILRDEHGSIYGKGVMTCLLPLLGEGEIRTPTFYTTHGDIFGWCCVTVTGCLLLAACLKRFKVAASGTAD
jgi:apolipoprotein N-acyltransferase